MELDYKLTGHVLCTAKYPKIERHILKYMKYYYLGLESCIYIIIMIVYNVITSLLDASEADIELPGYFMSGIVIPNLFLGGFFGIVKKSVVV